MDIIISELADDLLVKILLFLSTKVAVSTSILSKRWEFLWMWLPQLDYNDANYSETECKRLQCFLERNLPFHRAPVIESLRFKFANVHLKFKDVKLRIVIAITHIIRKLEISYSYHHVEPNILPSRLYTCKSLVILKLKGEILLDVPRMVCLPCLKTLRLKNVAFFNEDCLQRLLSNCHVLEDLSVDSWGDKHVRKFTVIVPSLQRLSLNFLSDADEFVINTPSLRYFELMIDDTKTPYFSIENMPKLREAYVDVRLSCLNSCKSLIRSISSFKRLKFCQEVNHISEVEYGDGFVFNKLEHLELCLCQEYVSNILVWFLKDFPNLQVLDFFYIDDHHHYGLICWNQPSTVTQCMLSSLQTFTWSGYLGRREDRDLAVYILEYTVLA